MVCKIVLREKTGMKKVGHKGKGKCRTWKLKDEAVREGFRERIRALDGEKEGEGVEGMWAGMKGSMLKAAEEVCGMTKGPPRHKETWWWNEDCDRVVKEKRRLFGEISLSLSLSLFVLRQFSSLARVRRFPISAMLPQRTILGRLFPQTPLFYRVLYVLLPSLNRSPYPPLPLNYQPPACRYHVPFVLSLQMPKPP